ncbi:QueT transporter family protein [Aerococcaceae bacterium DSM 111020]|nr:QueT transporter family protein [Aerococcaceae bacterium DSM 111020]
MNTQFGNSKAHDIVSIAVVAALYIIISIILAPLSFGIGLRISEGLNFLALYNRRHIYGLTLGVFFSNYFAYGALDMLIGSLSTLVFVTLGCWLADFIVNRIDYYQSLPFDSMLLKYLILSIVFSLSMFTIAGMVFFLDASQAFWPLYINMAVIEMLSMVLGGMLIYPISKRIDLTK